MKHKFKTNRVLIPDNNQLSAELERQKEDKLRSESIFLLEEIAKVKKEISDVNQDIQLCSSSDADPLQSELEGFNRITAESNLRVFSHQVQVLHQEIHAKKYLQTSNNPLLCIDTQLKKITELEEAINNKEFDIPENEITKLLTDLEELKIQLKKDRHEIKENIAALATLQSQLNRENIPVTLKRHWQKDLIAFWQDKFHSYKTKRDQKYRFKDALTQVFFNDQKKRATFQTELFKLLDVYTGISEDRLTCRLHDMIREGLKLFKIGFFSDRGEYNNLHELLLKLQKSLSIVEKNLAQGPAYKKS